MIDRNVFGSEFSILLERFGRADTASDLLIQRYLEFLDEHLSTMEFQAAAREIFNRDQFWPSPQRFVDAVHGNAKELASSEWQEVLRLATAGTTDLSSLTGQAQAALKASGGWRAVAYAESDYALDRLKRSFSEAYTLPVVPAGRALPEAQPVVLDALEDSL